MKIAIAGGTGFIGSKLANRLYDEGHDIYILTRNAKNKQNKKRLTFVEWLNPATSPLEQLEGTDAFVNLAGEPLMGRWTKSKKAQIVASRLEATNEVVALISKMAQKPSVLIQASAIGYYGHSDSITFTEADGPVNNNFLTEVARKWENAVVQAEAHGVRTVLTRIGIVLDKREGALAKMIIPYKLYAGGKVGSGRQWMSWIHIDDAVGLMAFAIQTKSIKGPLNVTAPHPVRMQHLNRSVANVLGRPYWLPAPAFAIKIALGEMSTLVLDGAYAYPKKAVMHDYPFMYTNIDAALKQVLT
ncbi:cell-division inhibitor [Niallia circulans]|nr:cell-division inhibitor [Niallia circulans]